MSFIAGNYAITYSASTVGQLENGPQIDHQVFKEIITGNNFAQSPQDAVFQGMSVFLQFTMLEYDATSARAAFWPYGSAFLTMDTVIGTLDSTNADQIVMTALTGSPAAASPATITIPDAILADGFPVQQLFAPQLRKIPIRMQCYPNGSGVFGTLT